MYTNSTIDNMLYCHTILSHMLTNVSVRSLSNQPTQCFERRKVNR